MRERTCIGCRKVSQKQKLHRIARTEADGVRFDATGQGPGRGAYVCSMECFLEARKKGKIASALRCKVSAEAYDEIQNGLRDAIKADALGCEGC